MKRLSLIAFVLLSLCLSLTARAEPFMMQTFFLKNGLQVVVVENHKAPIVKQMLFYKAGSVDEKPGKGGVAHLLEHLMFRGTYKVDGQSFNRLMEKNGADSNAFTVQDMTAYHQFVDVSRLELAMFLEADRMQNLNFGMSDFEAERNIVFQERKQRVDNNPTALFMEKVKKALWQNHPYGNPVTGQDEEILSLSKEDVWDFYRTKYAPNNAVLVLAGDIDEGTARKLAEKYYGGLKPASLEKKVFNEISDTYRARVEMSLPEVKIERLVRVYAVPSIKQNPKTAYALDVLSDYLTGDKNSPMYQKLVVRDKKALDVETSYDGITRSYGNFILIAVPKDKADPAFEYFVDRAFVYALRTMTEEKINKVKQKMLAELVYLKDNPSTLATLAGSILAAGGTLEDLQNYEAHIKAVRLEDIQEAAKALFETAPQAVGILHPKETSHE